MFPLIVAVPVSGSGKSSVTFGLLGALRRRGCEPRICELCPRSGVCWGALQPLVGIFPASARMLPRRKSLGYREVMMTAATPLGPAVTVARGHEFHCCELEMPTDVPRAYRVTARNGAACVAEGYLRGNVLGSYGHLHFASNPLMAENFVATCRHCRGSS